LASFTARISCRLKGGGQVSMNLMNFTWVIAPCVKLLHFVVIISPNRRAQIVLDCRAVEVNFIAFHVRLWAASGA